jgi:hypothetical protein
MGRAERTKREERRHLDAFLAGGGWGSAVSSIVERESPDFIVTGADGERCGVELRQLFADESASRGSGMRREEQQRQDWLGAVCARYYALGGLPASVNVNVRLGFDERLAARLLDRLLTVVPQLDPNSGDSEQLEIVDESEQLLAKVDVQRVCQEEPYTRWLAPTRSAGGARSPARTASPGWTPRQPRELSKIGQRHCIEAPRWER